MNKLCGKTHNVYIRNGLKVCIQGGCFIIVLPDGLDFLNPENVSGES